MSWRSSIYIVSIWSIFHFQPHFHYNSHNLIKADALVFTQFLEYLKLVLDDNIDKESSKSSGCCLAFA